VTGLEIVNQGVSVDVQVGKKIVACRPAVAPVQVAEYHDPVAKRIQMRQANRLFQGEIQRLECIPACSAAGHDGALRCNHGMVF
jgi:hypothetical protein